MPHDTLNGTGHALAAPVRNRYFYGKLLDVHHLQLEQRYFVEKLRLLNRLSLGVGVLAGLHVQVRGDAVVIGPGVAIDGCGREIVVTNPYVVDDPWALTDDCGVPTGERDEEKPVVLCLAYHECEIEPAPVLVSDCDVREECVAGAVRERFRLLVRSEVELPSGLTEEQCKAIFGAHEDALPTTSHEVLVTVPEAGQPVVYGGIRERICHALAAEPAAAADDCVPIALLRKVDDEIVVHECLPRTTIYSNATLLDLILCLAERVEECCRNGNGTATALPAVTGVFPKQGDSLSRQELAKPLEGKPAIALGFDRKMKQAQLAAPDEWLRVWAVLPPVGESNKTRMLKATLSLAETRANDLNGDSGESAFYTPDFGDAAEAQAFSPGMRWVVVVKADAAAPAIEDEQDSLLLDADYEGTGLTSGQLTDLWGRPTGSAPATFYRSLPVPQEPGFPSGTPAHEPGGLLHSWFEIEEDE